LKDYIYPTRLHSFFHSKELGELDRILKAEYPGAYILDDKDWSGWCDIQFDNLNDITIFTLKYSHIFIKDTML
jgi:hypothetical protein